MTPYIEEVVKEIDGELCFRYEIWIDHGFVWNLILSTFSIFYSFNLRFTGIWSFDKSEIDMKLIELEGYIDDYEK